MNTGSASARPRSALPEDGLHTGMITLGPVSFDAQNHKFIINGNTTELKAVYCTFSHCLPTRLSGEAGCKKRYGKMKVLLWDVARILTR